jgi:hypothetical protein
VVTAQVGRYNLSNLNETFDNFQIVQQYIHPKYKVGDFSYDYMLLKLSGSSQRQTISLNHNASVPYTDEALTVMGFGLTQYGNSSSVPNILQQVTVNVIANSVCNQAQVRGFSQSYVGEITPDMLCADDPGKDSCQGDSGGPLIIPSNDNSPSTDVQVGHVSWGLACAESAFPGVYARTSYGFAWIAATLCAISSHPPSEFNCQDNTSTFSPAPSGPPSPPTFTPAPTTSQLQVTVVIYLDDFPTETGWSIEDVGTGRVVINVPIGTYDQNWETVVKTVPLQGGKTYMFTIRNSFGEGMNSRGYQVVLGPSKSGSTILAQGNGHFLFESSQSFTMPLSYAPTAPGFLMTPSPSPAAMWDAIVAPSNSGGGFMFVTVDIQLDQNPEQTSESILVGTE